MKTNIFITPSETATILGLKLTAIYERLKENKIPHIRCGRRYIIRRDDVIERVEVLKRKSGEEK